MINISQLRQQFIEPSPQITEPDQRRQASLLSSFLLGMIVLSLLVEGLTVAFIKWEIYTGYRQTIIALCLFAIIYGISRTRHFRVAAVLSVIVASIAIFVSGWAEPAGVLGGLFDFLILPLWLGSLYLSMRAIVFLILFEMLALLVFPFFSPAITLSDILVGPFSFIFATSILLIVITRHRNHLEHDRRAELTEKEIRSRREAARAAALLRVAEQLNAQLDLDTLLRTICEEVTLALSTSVSIVALYDPKLKALRAATGVGIPQELIKSLSPIPLDPSDPKLQELGAFTEFTDRQDLTPLSDTELFTNLGLRSLAFALMEYEGEIVGGLTAISQNEARRFSEEELLLLQ